MGCAPVEVEDVGTEVDVFGRHCRRQWRGRETVSAACRKVTYVKLLQLLEASSVASS